MKKSKSIIKLQSKIEDYHFLILKKNELESVKVMIEEKVGICLTEPMQSGKKPPLQKNHHSNSKEGGIEYEKVSQTNFNSAGDGNGNVAAGRMRQWRQCGFRIRCRRRRRCRTGGYGIRGGVSAYPEIAADFRLWLDPVERLALVRLTKEVKPNSK